MRVATGVLGSQTDQLQQLADTNRFLTLQLAYYTRLLASIKTNPPPAPDSISPPPATTVVPPRPTTPTNPRPPANRTRTHTVAARETPAAIARKYGVSLNALLAANPGLNPKKMHVGQILNLPPS